MRSGAIEANSGGERYLPSREPEPSNTGTPWEKKYSRVHGDGTGKVGQHPALTLEVCLERYYRCGGKQPRK